MYGLVVAASSASAVLSGISRMAMMYWNIVETPISNSTTPVVLAALAAAFISLCQFIVR